MTLEQFIEQHGGWWAPNGHPDWPLELWQAEVANGDTRKGYWDWAYCSAGAAEEE